MVTINSTCYPRSSTTNVVKGRVKAVLLTLTGRPMWLPLAICLSMVALMLAGCGSEAPGTETFADSQASTPIVPATGAETEQPAATPAVVAVEIGHKVGQKAPGFMLTTVEGEQVSLEGFQGRPLVLYFYTTW